MSTAGPRGSFLRWVTQDWAVNAGYLDSRLVLLWFRAAQWAARSWGLAGRAFAAFYSLFTSLFIGVELPPALEVGPRLRIYHPHGIVLNPGVRLGADCVLRQHVTIGNIVRRDGTEKGVASAGDGVEFGAGCVVVGGLHVGSHARVAALALVLRDVPEWGVAVGNPAEVVRVDHPAHRRPEAVAG
ncbi:serine acetyltransferase [Geodermatophilus sp. TF02-6]|uniref:serine acetyltransferase n=1 Tax=Geodermatophilus sp. TF02-6 TaxID=2250575 RepID=UPI000DEA8380|nr:serine acetyltransferase [Geodermatophilus sp. TF02-6]RBY75290.1 serine acetyltransferase [Geodermatophilus sp. TF02-6]